MSGDVNEVGKVTELIACDSVCLLEIKVSVFTGTREARAAVA